MKREEWELRIESDYRGKLHQLVERAAWCHRQLETMTSVTTRLLKNEHFVTLLRAEGLPTVPANFSKHLTSSLSAQETE